MCVAAKVKLVSIINVTDVRLLVRKVKIAAMRCVPNLEPKQIVLVVVTLVRQQRNAAMAHA